MTACRAHNLHGGIDRAKRSGSHPHTRRPGRAPSSHLHCRTILATHLDRACARPVLAACAVALAVRVLYALVGAWAGGPGGMPDYWGDAYHNWIVERLTLENGFVFTDYKGRELVWLPLFRYLAALVMGVTGADGLLPGRLVSLSAGVGAVGFTAAATGRWGGGPRWALLGGLLLALNPWHVAYSWMNMPEAVGTLWIAMAFWALAPAPDGEPAHAGGGEGRYVAAALVLAGAAGALTRNDVTSILALTAGALLLVRRVRPALFLLGGLLVGLGVWSAWTGIVTGNPLWWLVRRAAGSTGDAGFWIARGSRPDAALFHLGLALLQACTVAVVALVVAGIGLRDPAARAAVRARSPGVPLVVGGIYVAIVGWMFTRFFSWPDPRYLMVAVVPLTVVAALVPSALRDGAGRRAAGILLAVAALSTALQLPTFPIRAWAHERDRTAGRALAALEARGEVPAGPLWIDAPVAIYTAGIDLDRIRSSDQITGWDGSDDEARAAARTGIRNQGIGLIYHDEVPYSRVHRIWPAMAEGLPFEDAGLRFVPIFHSDTVTRPAEPSVLRRAREAIQSKYGPVTLWRVEP